MILSICLNPTFQKTIILNDLLENEVNRSSDYRTDASGKGINVTRVLTQLNLECTHLTHLGKGKDQFLALAAEDNLKLVYTDADSEIRSCYTLINSSKSTTTEIVEEAHPVGETVEDSIKEKFEIAINQAEMLIISGSKAAGYSDGLFPWFVSKARDLGKFVILDYRGNDLLNSLQYQPDIIKPNFSEFVSVFFPQIKQSEHVVEQSLLEKVKVKMLEICKTYSTTIVLTSGGRPVLFTDSGRIRDLPIQLTENPLNTIGCGDSFTAGLASIIYTDCCLNGTGCTPLKEHYGCFFFFVSFIPNNIVNPAATPIMLIITGAVASANASATYPTINGPLNMLLSVTKRQIPRNSAAACLGARSELIVIFIPLPRPFETDIRK